MSDLKRIAERALRDGRIDDGIVAYRELIAAVPDDADSWYNLAYLLRCARRFDEALDAYAMALAEGIARPEETHLNRAVIFAEFLEDPAAAEVELSRAVTIAPAFVPAWLNLGNLHEDGGRPDAAREAYDRVVRIDPTNGRALARNAAIAVFEDRAAGVIPALRGVLSQSDIATVAQAEIGFALGSALDAEGQFDDAFVAYAEANRAAKAVTLPTYRYDRRAHERLIEALIAADPVPQPVVDGCDNTPIFICGMFRSGSTLVEQILSRHSLVTRGGELEIVPAFAAELAARSGWPGPLNADVITSLRRDYLAEVRRLHPMADLLTDKRPDNFLYIGLIKRLFPTAKIIHTTRHVFDTALSVYFNHFDDSVAYGNDLDDIAHWLTQYRRLMAHWTRLYPDDIHDVEYDALVRDPAPTIAKLLAFCGLQWEDGVLRPDQAAGAVRTASVWQVRKPLHQRSSGRWRNYAAHLAPLRTIFGDPTRV